MVAKLSLEFFVVETGILADEVVNKVFKIGLEMAVSTFDGVFGIQILRCEKCTVSVHYAQK